MTYTQPTDAAIDAAHADATDTARDEALAALRAEAQPAETDEFDMELSVTATSGVIIPMRLVVTYPKDHGFYAAKALQMVPDNMDGIWQELVRRQDASTVRVMLESPNNRGGNDE